MINNIEGTADYIVSWLKLQARMAKAESLVVGVSGGVDSAVVAALCLRSELPTHTVFLPCHSSPSAAVRVAELRESLEVSLGTDIPLEEAFDSIHGEVPSERDLTKEEERTCSAALRSCLRAPALDFVAKVYKGIVVGTGNRDEDEVVRYYQKRGDGAVDVSPIAALHKSEVYQLAAFLKIPQSIIDAVPSADLEGPNSGQTDEEQLGYSYAQIEKSIRLVDKMYATTQGRAFFQVAQILKSANLASEEFLALLQKLGNMEIATKHKHNPNLPVCNVRDPGLGLVD